MWKYVADGGFDSPRNTKVTWHMLLNQTSEWEGVMWDKPDLADRRRGYSRSLQEPGSFWEYNDVRVNRLALSLLRVWNKPLPQVLKDEVMDPIGASDTWVMARLPQLLRPVERPSGPIGQWRQPLGRRDLGQHARSCALRVPLPAQGQLERPADRLESGGWRWQLRPPTSRPTTAICSGSTLARRIVPNAPESSVFALGSGGNMIWIDSEHDLVVVTRWLDFAPA